MQADAVEAGPGACDAEGFAQDGFGDAAAAGDGPGGPHGLFAYQFFPLRLDVLGGAVEVRIESAFGASAETMSRLIGPEGLRFLGYDLVQRWAVECREGGARSSLPGAQGWIRMQPTVVQRMLERSSGERALPLE